MLTKNKNVADPNSAMDWYVQINNGAGFDAAVLWLDIRSHRPRKHHADRVCNRRRGHDRVVPVPRQRHAVRAAVGCRVLRMGRDLLASDTILGGLVSIPRGRNDARRPRSQSELNAVLETSCSRGASALSSTLS